MKKNQGDGQRRQAAATGLAALTLLAAPWLASAQEAAMGTVVVTATRTPIEEFKAPANISVITRETLDEKRYHDLGEALKDVPGVTIMNYGSSGANYSANSLMINGTGNVVVLVDGMRVNTNGNTSNKFSANELVDLSMVERIEVLKGSASTLYGSDAQGGVINIITRRVPDAQVSTTVGYSGGSYGFEQYNFRHAGSKDGFYWAISGQKRASDDYKDGDGKKIPENVKDKTWGLKLGKKFDDGVSFVELDYSRYLSDYMRPDNLGDISYTPVSGKKDNSRIALNYVQKLGDKLTNRLSVFRNRNDLDDAFDTQYDRWLMNLETDGVSDQLTFRSGDHVLIGGIDYYKDKLKDYQDYYGSIGKKSYSLTGYFIQDEWSFAAGWTLTPGVRLDHHSMYGDHTSPAVSLNYIANERTNYYVSYKEYFVAPNMYQLYSIFGNTDLNPEKGHTVEAGVKHQFDSTMNATFNVFKRDSEDIIIWKWIGPGFSDGKYVNFDEEKAHGASLTLSKSFLRHFTGTVGYTYTHIKAQDNANANRDGQLPKDAWNLGLNYAQDRFSADLKARNIDRREFRKADPYMGNKQTSYWVVDLAASYEPFKNTRLFAKANNLFDKYYTERAYYANPAQWYPQPGRNFQAGLEYTF
ncbi:TonB-dependent receptor plug domain-containing protein [Propionivibrio sp.]|uniref:TonB-dependent receptor plug domain-containing protein n=1 Tax=Propionivibrio sp. TaxID=2212460 RepID=UPI0039E687AF